MHCMTLNITGQGSGVRCGMRPQLGFERRCRDVRLQATNTASTVRDIETDQDVPPYIWYLLCNLFSTALTPAPRDPSKVYIEYLAIKAELRLVSSVLHGSMVASGPLDALAPAFRTPALGDSFTCATLTFTPRDRDTEMAKGVQTVPSPPAATLADTVFRVSPLSPFHTPGVEGYRSLGGTAVGATLGPKADPLYDSGTVRTEVTGGTALLPISIRVPIGAWHNMTEPGLGMIRRNLYFPFCAESSPDPIMFEGGIMVTVCYREQ